MQALKGSCTPDTDLLRVAGIAFVLGCLACQVPTHVRKAALRRRQRR